MTRLPSKPKTMKPRFLPSERFQNRYYHLLFLSLCLLPLGAFSQNYHTAAGVSLGTGIGLSVQQYLFDGMTLQTNLQHRIGKDQTNLVLLLEKHQKLVSRRFNFFVGGGMNVGWNKYDTPERNYTDNRFGLAGVAGVEFNPGRLNLAWDFTPTVFLTGDGNALQTQTAISVRYVLIKRKKKKKKWWPFGKKK